MVMDPIAERAALGLLGRQLGRFDRLRVFLERRDADDGAPLVFHTGIKPRHNPLAAMCHWTQRIEYDAS